MGYELWVSQATGYRRRGTRLIEVHQAFSHALTASSLFEPLLSCPANAPSTEMKAELHRRDFDVAGVRVAKVSPVIGYVTKESLVRGTVRECCREFSKDEEVIEESSDIRMVMDRLKTRSVQFVKVNGQIEGIITHADLNKPIVRTYLFGMVSLLELHMAFWIRTEYPGDAWMAVLSAGRVIKAAEIKANRNDLELFDCLQYGDRRELLVKARAIRASLSLGSRKDATDWLKKAEGLRNDLAHSQYYLNGAMSWPEVIELVMWIDALVSRSDALVEARAESLAEHHVDRLW